MFLRNAIDVLVVILLVPPASVAFSTDERGGSFSFPDAPPSSPPSILRNIDAAGGTSDAAGGDPKPFPRGPAVSGESPEDTRQHRHLRREHRVPGARNVVAVSGDTSGEDPRRAWEVFVPRSLQQPPGAMAFPRARRDADSRGQKPADDRGQTWSSSERGMKSASALDKKIAVPTTPRPHHDGEDHTTRTTRFFGFLFDPAAADRGVLEVARSFASFLPPSMFSSSLQEDPSPDDPKNNATNTTNVSSNATSTTPPTPEKKGYQCCCCDCSCYNYCEDAKPPKTGPSAGADKNENAEKAKGATGKAKEAEAEERAEKEKEKERLAAYSGVV